MRQINIVETRYIASPDLMMCCKHFLNRYKYKTLIYQCFWAIYWSMECYRIRVFNPKFLHLVFLAGKKNKKKEAVTIAYCLFPSA